MSSPISRSDSEPPDHGSEAADTDAALAGDALSPLRPIVWPPLVCLGLAVVGGVLAGWLHRGESGVGFATGVMLATGSFLFSAMIIAWADVVARQLILPVGLMTYALKIVLIGMVVFAVARRDWPGFPAMLWGIAAGTATWVIAQAVWTYRQALRKPRHDSHCA